MQLHFLQYVLKKPTLNYIVNIDYVIAVAKLTALNSR